MTDGRFFARRGEGDDRKELVGMTKRETQKQNHQEKPPAYPRLYYIYDNILRWQKLPYAYFYLLAVLGGPTPMSGVGPPRIKSLCGHLPLKKGDSETTNSLIR